MKKKKLKTMDLAELENTQQGSSKKTKKSPTNSSSDTEAKPRPQKRKANTSYQFGDERLKALGKVNQKQLANFISAKYSFDKMKLNPAPYAFSIMVLFVEFGIPFLEAITGGSGIVSKVFGVGIGILSMVSGIWPIWLILIFTILPYRKFTKTKIRVSFDHLEVPCDLDTDSHKFERIKLKWSQIADYKFIKPETDDIPKLILLDRKGEKLGVMRLDITEKKKFEHALFCYIPYQNPLRKFFNNSKNFC